MLSVSITKDSTMEHPQYDIFCPRPGCGYVYESFQDTHLCPYLGIEIDIDDREVKD